MELATPTLVARPFATVRRLRREHVLALAVLALALGMRLGWAAVTSWREDQAATLWLGATQPLLQRPVGLISSTNFPNPNGMTFIGSLLALAPGLYGSSVLLGIIQMALLGWLCREVCRAQPLSFLLAGLALACDPAVAYPGVDLWNQYTVGLCDLVFIASAVRFCRAPSWRFLPLWACLAIAVPGLYLAGLVNAAAYTIIAMLLVVVHRRTLRKQPVILHLGLAVAVCAVVGYLIWLPFIRGVDFTRLGDLSHRLAAERLRLTVEAVWAAPAYAITTLQMQMLSIAPCDGNFPWQGAKWLRTAWTTAAGEVLLFGVAALSVHGGLALRRRPSVSGPTSNPPWLPVAGILLCLGFVWLNLVLSPLFGGPRLATGGRPDQGVRLIPLIIVAAVMAATANLGPEPLRRALRWYGIGLVGIYILLGTTAGAVLMTRHLTYRGHELTAADVSLLNKRRVARFIAHDWHTGAHEGRPSVYYRLMSDKWTFLPEWGRKLRARYPEDVYTTGRGFDYELWRTHGMRNAQEGHERTPAGARYIVTYAHEPAPDANAPGIRHTILDRLRVSIVPDPAGRAD